MAFLRHSIAAMALLGALTAPALADGDGSGFREGAVTIYTRTGAVIQKNVADKALLDRLTRDAAVFPAGTMVVMHDGKTYMVKDTKMPNGHMMSDMVMNQ